jgi:hypothetical protein
VSVEITFRACAYSRHKFSDARVLAEVSMLAFYLTILVSREARVPKNTIEQRV